MSSPGTRKKRSEPSLFRLLADDGSVAEGTDPGIQEDVVLRIYRAMVLLRALDERMLLLQRQGRIGFWGPTTGQEAATIGSCAALEERDWVFPALREAGCALYRGFPLKEMVAQCFGNSADRSHGRQMPCHYSFREGNYVSMSSVIGTQIPHAVGAAMAARLRGDDTVVAGYMGDGATSSTDFHSAMNFAAVYKSPCVLICQNNQWAISVPIADQTASETIADKALAYGMESVRVDGNDALAVYLATKKAVDKARIGGGPTFLELLTYRVLGHSSSDDPTIYRSDEEVKKWRDKDPIPRLRTYLESRGWWSGEKEEELEGIHSADIARAVREAEASPSVDPSTLVRDVYAEVPKHLSDQMDATLRDLKD